MFGACISIDFFQNDTHRRNKQLSNTLYIKQHIALNRTVQFLLSEGQNKNKIETHIKKSFKNIKLLKKIFAQQDFCRRDSQATDILEINIRKDSLSIYQLLQYSLWKP